MLRNKLAPETSIAKFFKPIMLLLALVAMRAYGQDIPLEWAKYRSANYISSFEEGTLDEDCNPDQIDITKRQLRDLAIKHLAQQIEINISDHAQISQEAINGFANETYIANTTFKTDLNLSLIGTETKISKDKNNIYVVAYIDKANLRSFCIAKLEVLINDANRYLEIASMHLNNSQKKKAQEEVNNAERTLNDIDESLFWLNVVDTDLNQIIGFNNQKNDIKQKVASITALLVHSISICIKCSTDLFGMEYPALAEMVGEALSSKGCQFVNYEENADWIVSIDTKVEAESVTDFGGSTTYFVWVGGSVNIKRNNADPILFQKHIKRKGGHPSSKKTAGINAYDAVSKDISNYVITSIDL